MAKLPPYVPAFPFTDVILLENTRDTAGTLTTILRINGEEVSVTFEQGDALLRNSREVAQARENKIIYLLEQECKCNEDDPFCWAAQAIDLIQKAK